MSSAKLQVCEQMNGFLLFFSHYLGRQIITSTLISPIQTLEQSAGGNVWVLKSVLQGEKGNNEIPCV